MSIFATDTETLGLTPGKHRVIELSFALIKDHNWDDFSIETFRFTPTDDHFAEAHERALAVNGYYQGHPDWKGAPVIGTPEAAEVWGYILSRARGATLLCQNVPFDRGMIWEELRLHGQYDVPVGVGPEDGPWTKHCIEVKQSSKALQKRHNWPSASLNPLYENCRAAFQAPLLQNQHRSESDVVRALWVWAHAAELAGDASVPSKQVKVALDRWLTRQGVVVGPPPFVLAESDKILLDGVELPSALGTAADRLMEATTLLQETTTQLRSPIDPSVIEEPVAQFVEGATPFVTPVEPLPSVVPTIPPPAADAIDALLPPSQG